MPIEVYKPIGMTPLEIVEDYKQKNNIKKACFAGRLDPMAHGVMKLLINDECKLLDTYCAKEKIYEFKVLFGFETDTYDVLGKVIKTKNISKLEKIDWSKYLGEIEQPYPPYSSIVINKKSLWEWAKLDLLDTIIIPSKKVNISYIEELENNESYDMLSLKKTIFSMIESLDSKNKTKFRVDEIMKCWNSVFSGIPVENKPIIKKFRAKVSSGTYIRSLAHNIGKDLETGAIALDIKRTEIL